MKLEVGMYVRTKEGLIHQILDTEIQIKFRFDTGINIPFYENGEYKNQILKASHNIIDLIEEDDLIKCQFGEQILMLQVGARYTTSHPENDWIKGVFTPDNEFWSLETLQQEDILQSIVTKEMFSNVEYRVETD